MVKNLCLYETRMYFRCISYLIIVILWGVSHGGFSMLLKFGQKIYSNKGVDQNGFFIYFGGFKHLDGYYWIVCCSLGPVLVI